MPKVSVIIPCYNHGQYVDEAVESVLNQTFQDFEIIIVNDGSTDKFTVEKLSNYKKAKTKVLQTSNQGLSAARNNGIKIAEGEYILPLDADDKIGDTYLEEAVNTLNNNKKIKIVYCLGKYYGGKEAPLEQPKLIEFKQMLLYSYIFCSGIFRVNDFFSAGGYNEDMKLGSEDWDFWIRLLKDGGEVYRIDKILFYYRYNSNSMDHGSTEEKRKERNRQILYNHTDLYLKYYPDLIEILREYEILKHEADKLEYYKQQIYNSLSYRIGNIILWPFKLFKKIINK